MKRVMPANWPFNGDRLFRTALVVMAIALPIRAHASLVWDWSYAGAGITAAGTFTTDGSPDSDGYYQITSISGSRNGEVITDLVPAGEAIAGNPGYPVDNLISAGGLLTANGFGYETADGNYANPYYATFLSTPAFYEVFTQPASDGFSELPVDFTAAVAEPGTLGILLAGLVPLVTVRSGAGRLTADRAIPAQTSNGPSPP